MMNYIKHSKILTLMLFISFSSHLAANDLSREEFMESAVGRYAHYDIVAYNQKVARNTMRTLIITYGFTDLKIENDQLIATESFCHAEQLSSQPFVTKIPDAMTTNIVPKSTPVDIKKQNGKWGFFRPETPTPIGVKLDDWANEPFPQDPNDPRLSDDDQDGKPGVTVKIRAYWLFPVEIYIARREIFAYHVFQQKDGKLEGHVRDRSEQIIIGSSPEFLKIPNAPFIQDKDPKKSPIILVPVSEDYDCSRLMKERKTLFPRNPKP
ncbi:MAG: hypothetical protein HRU09_08355 [Oligoflexales bacterium]|nr:hypothetical protein [Oligoflexales bacterium]